MSSHSRATNTLHIHSLVLVFFGESSVLCFNSISGELFMTSKYLASRITAASLAVCCVCLIGTQSASAALTNPENFERFNNGDNLTLAEGWDPNVETASAGHSIATINDPSSNPTKALLIQTTTATNYALVWQQTINDLGSPTQVIFGFDALMQDNVAGVPSRVMVHSQNQSFFWAVNENDGSESGKVNMYLAPTSNYLTPDLSPIYNTWYRFEVQLDLVANTVSARYGLAGTPLGAFGTPLAAAATINPSDKFNVFSMDTVYYDNFSLVAVPEPSSIISIASACIVSLAWASRKQRITKRCERV